MDEHQKIIDWVAEELSHAQRKHLKTHNKYNRQKDVFNDCAITLEIYLKQQLNNQWEFSHTADSNYGHIYLKKRELALKVAFNEKASQLNGAVGGKKADIYLFDYAPELVEFLKKQETPLDKVLNV